MKHIFLTGNPQVGKSTTIWRLLAEYPQLRVGGFRTVAGPILSGAVLRGDGYWQVVPIHSKSKLVKSDNGVDRRWEPGNDADEKYYGGDAVYMLPADRDVPFTADNLLFERWYGESERRFCVFPQVFDTLGVALLKDAVDCDLMIMDEIGLREQNSNLFKRAILAKLAGDIPVLGVVQRWEGEFVERIRNHPNVELITVTEENREYVLQELLYWIEPVVMNCFM